jgi:hypothetical protein
MTLDMMLRSLVLVPGLLDEGPIEFPQTAPWKGALPDGRPIELASKSSNIATILGGRILMAAELEQQPLISPISLSNSLLFSTGVRPVSGLESDRDSPEPWQHAVVEMGDGRGPSACNNTLDEGIAVRSLSI